MPTGQSFRNHARIVPAYHVGVFVPFVANFIWATYQLIRAFSGQTLIDFLVAIALLLMFFSLRVQVLIDFLARRFARAPWAAAAAHA